MLLTKGLFTWREEDRSTRKIREVRKTFRLLYMQKFRPKGLLRIRERRITEEAERPGAAMFALFVPSATKFLSQGRP